MYALYVLLCSYQIRSLLVQIMAWHNYSNWTLGNKFWWNLDQNDLIQGTDLKKMTLTKRQPFCLSLNVWKVICCDLCWKKAPAHQTVTGVFLKLFFLCGMWLSGIKCISYPCLYCLGGVLSWQWNTLRFLSVLLSSLCKDFTENTALPQMGSVICHGISNRRQVECLFNSCSC